MNKAVKQVHLIYPTTLYKTLYMGSLFLAAWYPLKEEKWQKYSIVYIDCFIMSYVTA